MKTQNTRFGENSRQISQEISRQFVLTAIVNYGGRDANVILRRTRFMCASVTFLIFCGCAICLAPLFSCRLIIICSSGNHLQISRNHLQCKFLMRRLVRENKSPYLLNGLVLVTTLALRPELDSGNDNTCYDINLDSDCDRPNDHDK